MTQTAEHGAMDRVTAIMDRVHAIKLAQQILTFAEPNADDLIIVADWLLTGCADTALRFSEQRARHWQRHQHGDLGPDTVSWTAGGASA